MTTTSTSTNPLAQLGQNYSTFLTMLTTQLKNQDPTSPMDASQFTNQLVLFSQVEQQINMNSKLDQLVTSQTATQTAAALGYIGLKVDAPGSDFSWSGSPVTLGYTLPSDAAATNLVITDESGNPVWAASGATASGSHSFTWNGTDGDGNTLPQGNYKLTVTATDSTNSALGATGMVPGIVDGIETDSGTVYLTVNGSKVAANDVVLATEPN